MKKAKPRQAPKKVPTGKKALAAAKILVDGKSTREAARETGISAETARVAAKEAATDPDLGQYLAAYRAKALPKWLEVIDKGAEAALKVMPKSSGRDIAALVKVFGDMSNRAAGEADVTHDHRGQLEGARESLAARIATLADSRAKGSGS